MNQRDAVELLEEPAAPARNQSLYRPVLTNPTATVLLLANSVLPSSRSYDKRHLLIRCRSWRLLPCRRCSANPEHTWSKRLGELCRLLFFPLTTMPSKSYPSCCGVKKMGLAPEGEAKSGRELFSTHRLISVEHAFF